MKSLVFLPVLKFTRGETDPNGRDVHFSNTFSSVGVNTVTLKKKEKINWYPRYSSFHGEKFLVGGQRFHRTGDPIRNTENDGGPTYLS